MAWPTPVEDIDTFEKNNPEWAVNIIAMKAYKHDEEIISKRQKRKKKKKITGKDFLLQETNQKEDEDSEKKGKIEMFPFR